ncbi:MAG: cytochrome c peroxidase [Vicingaceae bacterium]
MKNTIRYLGIFSLILILAQCEPEDKADAIKVIEEPNNGGGTTGPTPYTLQLPEHFALIGDPFIPSDNPLTEEGIALGKKLFFERKLSKNNQISCATCHKPQFAFNDEGNPVSFGVGGAAGVRNAMPLFNLGWVPRISSKFNWHGSATSLEEQAFEPVINPVEMQENWPDVVGKLQSDPVYPPLFEAAFETNIIDSNLVVKAISQFQRTLISGNSRFDNYIKRRFGYQASGPDLTQQELRGYNLFVAEDKGDCAHCHADIGNPLMTNFAFVNNGLDAQPDSGLALVTKKASDIGKFKTPSVRNLVFTAPYMHDGRFNTLRQVVDFYVDSVQQSPTLDGLMNKTRVMNNQEREDVVAFLKSMTDSSFVNNPAFRP